MRPDSDAQSVFSFSVVPKCMTLNDLHSDFCFNCAICCCCCSFTTTTATTTLNGYFPLNSVFAPVWLAPAT